VGVPSLLTGLSAEKYIYKIMIQDPKLIYCSKEKTRYINSGMDYPTGVC
jgi:hypothetical protein